MRKIKLLSLLVSFILLFFIVFKIVGLLGWNKGAERMSLLPEGFQLDGEGDIIFGSPDAGCSVYLFANYRCQFCLSFFKEGLPQILDDYDGKVKVVFKPILFSHTQEEMDALRMAVSVFKYGDYLPFHTLLLRDPDVIYADSYKDYLMEIMGLNSAIANSYFDDATKKYIDDNKKMFKELKIKGTPGFVVDKHVITGFSNMKLLLDNKFKSK